ncbi:MAG: hypothetical protein HGA49_00130 [Eubacteriaceae bacterium]|nr:hypothetical protein [Eubacteriaceae bacterium]
MKKYMGNKSKTLNVIYAESQLLTPETYTIFDAFAGTTNVGQYFKSKGYTVISNDVNTTSRLLGNVYLELNEIPSFSLLFSSNCLSIRKLNELVLNGELHSFSEKLINQNRNTNNEFYMQSIRDTNAFKLLVYLSFIASVEDYDDPIYRYKLLAPDFIWRNYCFQGYKSRYFNLVSQKSIVAQIKDLKKIKNKSEALSKIITLLQRIYKPPYNVSGLKDAIENLNTLMLDSHDSTIMHRVKSKLIALSHRNNHVGNRMFFSEIHGRKIDTINNLSLLWFKDGLISSHEYNYLQCALLEAVALFSNTSATYQAFYKTYRENTKQTFRLVVPEIISSSKKHSVYCEDTFEIIQNIPQPYDILYLDPPYNWRIYDSNYHLLNLIADYNNIADYILEYEEGIAGAAGENRLLERGYTNYNRRNTFEDLLFRLILTSQCKYVIISYSDSLSNHNKNSLSSVEKIENFLSDPNYFISDSYKKVEVSSIKFESRKSEKKDKINELLFIAQKRE